MSHVQLHSTNEGRDSPNTATNSQYALVYFLFTQDATNAVNTIQQFKPKSLGFIWDFGPWHSNFHIYLFEKLFFYNLFVIVSHNILDFFIFSFSSLHCITNCIVIYSRLSVFL